MQFLEAYLLVIKKIKTQQLLGLVLIRNKNNAVCWLFLKTPYPCSFLFRFRSPGLICKQSEIKSESFSVLSSWVICKKENIVSSVSSYKWRIKTRKREKGKITHQCLKLKKLMLCLDLFYSPTNLLGLKMRSLFLGIKQSQDWLPIIGAVLNV